MSRQYLTKGGFSNDLINGTFLVPKDGFSDQNGVINGTGTGTIGDIQLTAANGHAAINDTGTGTVADIQLTAIGGSVAIGDNGIGTVGDIQLTAINGSALVNISASGSIADIQLSAINGSATTETDAVGTGLVGDIQLTAANGTSAITSNGIGEIGDIQLTAINGSAEVNAIIGTGTIAPIDLSPINGHAAVSFGVHKSVIWQYDNSPILNAIIHSFEPPLDSNALYDNFVQKIWDVRTANSQGLDILGRIVGVSRYLSIPATGYFGFEPDYTPFDDKPFFHGSQINDQFKLSNDLYRKVILTKALNNISGSSIPELERALNLLFGDKGVCKVIISGFSEMTYEFHFTPEPIDTAIIATPGLIPQPAGHKIIKVFV